MPMFNCSRICLCLAVLFSPIARCLVLKVCEWELLSSYFNYNDFVQVMEWLVATKNYNEILKMLNYSNSSGVDYIGLYNDICPKYQLKDLLYLRSNFGDNDLKLLLNPGCLAVSAGLMHIQKAGSDWFVQLDAKIMECDQFSMSMVHESMASFIFNQALRSYGPRTNLSRWLQPTDANSQFYTFPAYLNNISIDTVLLTLNPGTLLASVTKAIGHILERIMAEMRDNPHWDLHLAGALLVSSWKMTFNQHFKKAPENFKAFEFLWDNLKHRHHQITEMALKNAFAAKLDTEELLMIRYLNYLATDTPKTYSDKIFSMTDILKWLSGSNAGLTPDFFLNLVCSFSRVGISMQEMEHIFLPMFFAKQPSAQACCLLLELMQDHLYTFETTIQLLQPFVISSSLLHKEIWLDKCPRILQHREIAAETAFTPYRYRKFFRFNCKPATVIDIELPNVTDQSVIPAFFSVFNDDTQLDENELFTFRIHTPFNEYIPTGYFIESMLILVMNEPLFWIELTTTGPSSGRKCVIPSPLMPLCIWEELVWLLAEAARFNVSPPFVIDSSYYYAVPSAIFESRLANQSELMNIFTERIKANRQFLDVELPSFKAMTVLESEVQTINMDYGVIPYNAEIRVGYKEIIQAYYGARHGPIADSTFETYSHLLETRFLFSATLLRDKLEQYRRRGILLTMQEMYQIIFFHHGN